MPSNTTNTKARYFIPIYGSYYHFLNESALGLYNMLRKESLLDSLDCRLWYQGRFGEIVQMFSANPIVQFPLIKPYLKNASLVDPKIKVLKHVRLGRKVGFQNLLPMVEFLSHRIPRMEAIKGITIIKRETKRVYLETEELADKLKRFQIPIRVVQLEREPFASQVNFMRNTQILIAPHGAGTMNQIFMPKGGKIIELFPMGYTNWHAKAVADVFGHNLIELESEKPGPFGRQPSEEIRRWIEENGWPDRKAVQRLRKRCEDYARVVRDVAVYSISPERIVQMVEKSLLQSRAVNNS
jgi:hypothetical protein